MNVGSQAALNNAIKLIDESGGGNFTITITKSINENNAVATTEGASSQRRRHRAFTRSTTPTPQSPSKPSTAPI